VDILGEVTADHVALMLKQHIFAAIAAIRVCPLKVVEAVDLEHEPKLLAYKVDLSVRRAEGEWHANVELEQISRDWLTLQQLVQSLLGGAARAIRAQLACGACPRSRIWRRRRLL
jgi:hypothetical protein